MNLRLRTSTATLRVVYVVVIRLVPDFAPRQIRLVLACEIVMTALVQVCEPWFRTFMAALGRVLWLSSEPVRIAAWHLVLVKEILLRTGLLMLMTVAVLVLWIVLRVKLSVGAAFYPWNVESTLVVI